MKVIIEFSDEEVKHFTKSKETKTDDYVSVYARCFDEGCYGWQKSAEYNLTFLKHAMQYANDMLKNKGHVFLNEIYDMLGIPRSKAGQIVGWRLNGPNSDNFIDFDLDAPRNANFINGKTNVVLLDFNVDGPILDD